MAGSGLVSASVRVVWLLAVLGGATAGLSEKPWLSRRCWVPTPGARRSLATSEVPLGDWRESMCWSVLGSIRTVREIGTKDS